MKVPLIARLRLRHRHLQGLHGRPLRRGGEFSEQVGGRDEGSGERMAVIIGDTHGDLAAAKAFVA